MKSIGLVDGDALRREYMRKSAGKDKLRIGTVINTLETMPILHPVDAVEVVHARWDFSHTFQGITEGDPVEFMVFKCSKCGGSVFDFVDYNGIDYAYCPRCGARMDGVKNA